MAKKGIKKVVLAYSGGLDTSVIRFYATPAGTLMCCRDLCNGKPNALRPGSERAAVH